MAERNKQVRIHVVFAPLPEEERDVERSAAKEFALRTAVHFEEATATSTATSTSTSTTNGIHTTELFHLADWDKEAFVESITTRRASPDLDNNVDDGTETETKTSTNTSTSSRTVDVVVFLISCGPDGSVHRQVRKITKWFKDQSPPLQTPPPPSESTTTAIVALLGHSVCKTSAEQMADEVYSTGRRLAKSIRGVVPGSSQSTPKLLLETQVELEAPEDTFDPWVRSWVELLLGKQSNTNAQL
eukprot:jgi/Psemu1/53144/gm1.53144_g